MKRLLLLLPLLLTPAAQAMDYVKCDAMQKALQRVRNSREQESSAVWKSNLRAMETRKCGPKPSPIASDYTTDKLFAWYDCSKAAYRSGFDNLKILQQEALAPLDAKAERIQADYDAEGCY